MRNYIFPTKLTCSLLYTLKQALVLLHLQLPSDRILCSVNECRLLASFCFWVCSLRVWLFCLRNCLEFFCPPPCFFFFFLTIYDVLSKFFFINLGGKEEKKRTSTETFVCPNIDTDLAK